MAEMELGFKNAVEGGGRWGRGGGRVG